MDNRTLAKLANYGTDRLKERVANLRLAKAMNALSELLNIQFGSVTIHFHNGTWNRKLEIKKQYIKEIEE